MKKGIINFAHANGFPGEAYNRVLSHFENEYRIIKIHKLGHNPSFPVNDNWTNLADELTEFIKKNSDSPVIGIGHSLGSLVTFIAAYKNPELFKAIIMLDPPFFIGIYGVIFHLLKITGIADRFTPANQSSKRKRYWDNMDEVISYFTNKALFAGFHPDTLRDYIKYGLRQIQNGYELDYDVDTEVKIFQTMPHNIGKYKKPLNIPGAIIYGENSHAVHMPTLKSFTKRHSFRLCTSPGGHLFPLEKPDETAETIKRELKALLN
ncbi:MAG: Alpha/beta hydrolase family protein [Spirochaetes bacterium ADurb.Bin218]|nr:MAG: Alpha/beta hydrolase family protein [Spirochaetes bacterium ADurb.Bin218]